MQRNTNDTVQAITNIRKEQEAAIEVKKLTSTFNYSLYSLYLLVIANVTYFGPANIFHFWPLIQLVACFMGLWGILNVAKILDWDILPTLIWSVLVFLPIVGVASSVLFLLNLSKLLKDLPTTVTLLWARPSCKPPSLNQERIDS